MTDHLCPVPSVFCDKDQRDYSETIRGKDLAKIWIFCGLFVVSTAQHILHQHRSVHWTNAELSESVRFGDTGRGEYEPNDEGNLQRPIQSATD
jgi:hypothetical protein